MAVKRKISTNSIHQADLVLFLTDIVTLVNELRTDYAALLADVTEIRTKLIATHTKLDADAGVTDVNYASTNNPAALTATAIAAAALSLNP